MKKVSKAMARREAGGLTYVPVVRAHRCAECGCEIASKRDARTGAVQFAETDSGVDCERVTCTGCADVLIRAMSDEALIRRFRRVTGWRGAATVEHLGYGYRTVRMS